MKPLLSIYFVDFWHGFDIQNNFFTDVLSTRYTLVFDKDSPSLLIYSLFGFSFLKYNNSTRLVYIGENVRPSFWQSDFALSFDYSSSAGRNYRLPLYALYNKDKCKLLEPKNVDDIVKQKSKFCNMLVSNPRKCVRLDFFNILNKNSVLNKIKRL